MDGRDESECGHNNGHYGDMWAPLQGDGGMGHVRPVVIKIGYPSYMGGRAGKHHSTPHHEMMHPPHPHHPHHVPMMHHGHHDNNNH